MATLKRVAGPCDHSHLSLKRMNPEPQLKFSIVDAPGQDVEGREAHPDYYQICARVPGGEFFYVIEDNFGGVIPAGKHDLSTVVNILQWVKSHRAELNDVEKHPIAVDGDYDFVVYTVDRNGFVSRESNIVRLTLSMTSPEPCEISATPIPTSIVETAFGEL